MNYSERHYVYQILEMHLAINAAKSKGQRFPASHAWVGEYKGFDGNHEGSYLRFAQQLVNAVEDFSSLRSRTYDAHNSGSWRYAPMVAKWLTLENRDQLSSADLRLLAQAVEDDRPVDDRQIVTDEQ